MPYKRTGNPPGRPKKKIPPNDGRKPQLTDNQWAALGKEYQGVKDWAREPWPSEAQAIKVSQAAGVSRQMVYRWRRDEIYRRGLVWLASADLSAHLMDNNGDGARVPLTDRQRAALLGAHVAKHWTGPTESIIDDKTYDTIESYVEHLLEHGVIPYADAVSMGQKR